MSSNQIHQNIDQNRSSSNSNTFQFNSSFISHVVSKSSSKNSIHGDNTLNHIPSQKTIFPYKEFEPKKYSSKCLSQNKTSRSTSTMTTITQDQSFKHKPHTISRRDSYFNKNQTINTIIIEETKKNIQNRVSTLNSWVNQVDVDGFQQFRKVLLKRAKKRNSLEMKNSMINASLKVIKKSANDVMISNGKIYTETSIYKHRAKSSKKQKINPNQIVSIKIELPEYKPKVMILNKERDDMGMEAIQLKMEIEYLQRQIQNETMNISDQEKTNEQIRKQTLFLRKQIIAIKEKISFLFDANEKYMMNVHQLVKDKSLLCQEN